MAHGGRVNPARFKGQPLVECDHVRTATTAEDVDDVIRVMRRIYDQTEMADNPHMRVRACERSLRAAMHSHLVAPSELDRGQAVLFYTETSVFFGRLERLYYNLNALIGQEVMWRSCGGDGLRVLRCFEDWADRRGAVRIVVNTFAQTRPEKMRRVMARYGYEPEYVTYAKKLV